MHRNEWKWKHNNPNPVGLRESSGKGNVHPMWACLKKQDRSQIESIALQLKQLEGEEMKHPRVSRRKEIIKIRAEETKENIAKINKAKSWFLEKVNKTDKPIPRLVKKQRDKNQTNKIRNENGEITTENTEIQRIIRRVLSAIICQ